MDHLSSKTWLLNFIQSYTERDLPLLGMPASPLVIRRFLTMLAKLSNPEQVSWFQPFSFNIKKRLVKSPKVYIRDSGVLHYLDSISDFVQLQGNILVRNSWEGYVIEQIRQISQPEIDLYFYRTHNGAECNLLLVRGLQPVSAIEIKYTSAPKISKGFNIAIEDLGRYLKYPSLM